MSRSKSDFPLCRRATKKTNDSVHFRWSFDQHQPEKLYRTAEHPRVDPSSISLEYVVSAVCSKKESSSSSRRNSNKQQQRMKIVVENRVQLSSAESMELVVPHFDTVESGTEQDCTFKAGGVSWQVEVNVGLDLVVVSIGYQGSSKDAWPTYKDIYSRLGDDKDEMGEHEIIFESIQSLRTIHAVAHTEVLDPKRTFLDKDKGLRILLLIKNQSWFPKRPVGHELLIQMQKEDQYMDTTFLVGGQTFHAHKSVLQMGCPVLYEMVRDATTEEPVELPNIHPEDFEQIMNWIYRNEVNDDFCEPADSQDILTAANKFGLNELKVHIESAIADCSLNVPSAAEWMVWAHNNCCPLLQEAAMELYLLVPKVVGQSAGWQMVKDCPALMEELLEMSVLARLGSSKRQTSVTALREHLLRIGLGKSIDGSRAMMVKALADRGVWVA
jgi:BTB/POZ domain